MRPDPFSYTVGIEPLREISTIKSIQCNKIKKKHCTYTVNAVWLKLCCLWPQVPRSGRRAHGRRSAQYPGGAHTVPDAAHCPTDCRWHGLPGLAALCPQRLGDQELPGRRKPAGQDRRLWHVQRRLQHRLLQGESPTTLGYTQHGGRWKWSHVVSNLLLEFFLHSSLGPKRLNSC